MLSTAICAPSSLYTGRSFTISRTHPTAEVGKQTDPDKGVLALTVDSAQWFAWLASTNTLTFQGRHGSLTATRRLRRGKRLQSWNVYRGLHGHTCTLYAGMTMTLTIARMEGLAQQLLTRLAHL